MLNGEPTIWSDGTSFAAVGSGTWLADNWRFSSAGAVVATVQRSTERPAISLGGVLANYSLHVDVTTADASLAATDQCSLQYWFEGYRALPVMQRVFTVGFWVRAAKTGVHYLAARNSAGTQSCVMPYTIATADTWEWHTVTFTASASSSWNTTTSTGLILTWTLAAGSDFLTTAGAWQSSAYLAASGVVNEVDSTANNFYLHGVTIREGYYAEPFAPRPHADEQRDAERYYEVLGGTALQLIGVGEWISSTQIDVHAVLRAEKRTAPTITVGTVGNLVATLDGSTIALTALALQSSSATRDLLLRGTVLSGGTAGKAGRIMVASGQTEKVYVNARF